MICYFSNISLFHFRQQALARKKRELRLLHAYYSKGHNQPMVGSRQGFSRNR